MLCFIVRPPRRAAVAHGRTTAWEKQINRGFSKTSVFGKATLDLAEKPAKKLVFQSHFQN